MPAHDLSPQARRPQTTQQYVLDELRRAIIARELKPGEPIRQDALAERLGVSRVPVREALRILEGEGQVLYLPRRGYQVVELSMDDLIEVYHLRRLLETEAIGLGLPAIDADDLDELERLQEEIETAGDAGDLIEMSAANRRFHFLVFDLAGMPRLSRMLRQLWDATDAYRSLYYAVPHNREHVRDEHRMLLDAARARDVERFTALQDDHRGTAVRALSPIVDSGPRDASLIVEPAPRAARTSPTPTTTALRTAATPRTADVDSIPPVPPAPPESAR